MALAYPPISNIVWIWLYFTTLRQFLASFGGTRPDGHVVSDVILVAIEKALTNIQLVEGLVDLA
jgi:hypothetical protein